MTSANRAGSRDAEVGVRLVLALKDHMLRPFAVLALVVVTFPAAAQDSWPSKPITVIVPLFGCNRK